MNALSDEQTAAVQAPEPQIVVTAGPGSGKTRTLVARIVHLLARGVPAASIVAITYTRRAADEAAARVRLALLERSARPAVPTVTTIHGWCALYLRRVGHLVGLPRDFEVLSDADAMQARSQRREHRDYLDALRASGAVDYDGLLEKATRAVRLGGPHLIDHLLIDETQDLSPAEADLVEAIRARPTAPVSLFAVGDQRQAIFGWRGGDPQIMARWAAEGAVYALRENYRAAPTLVARLNGSGARMRAMRPSTDDSSVAIGAPLLDWVRPDTSTAVLGRTWRNLRPVVKALRTAGVPCHYYEPAHDIWLSEVGRLAWHYLSLHGGPGSDIRADLLLGTLAEPGFVLDVRAAAARKRVPMLDEAMTRWPSLREVFAFARDRNQDALTLDALLRLHVAMGPDRRIRLVPWHIEDATAIHEQLGLSRWARLDGTIEYDRWSRWAAWRGVPERLTDEPLVHVMTTYAAKGLEWARVAVVDLSSDQYDAGNPEHRNLLYVAASRARDHLLLTWPEGTSPSALL